MLARRTNTMPLPGHTSPLEDASSLTQKARAASLSAIPSHMPRGLPSYQTALASVAGPASAMRPAGSPLTPQPQVHDSYLCTPPRLISLLLVQLEHQQLEEGVLAACNAMMYLGHELLESIDLTPH